MLLSEDLKKWRAERPDEWTMDRFILKAKCLETSVNDIESFITGRLECASDRHMRGAYRDVLFLVRQHLKVHRDDTAYASVPVSADDIAAVMGDNVDSK